MPGLKNETVETINAEIVERFGFFPPFFEPAQSSVEILSGLWHQTLTNYVDSPIPALFKERLAAVLARECTIPYCLIVHSCSLSPLGMTPAQVLNLLTQKNLRTTDTSDRVNELRQIDPISAWPDPEAPLDKLLFDTATIIFNKSVPEINVQLRRVLGENLYSHLCLFLSYNHTCHRWAESHPELSFEADKRALMHLQPLLEEVPELDLFFKTYQIRLRQRLVDREGELLSKEFRTLFEKSPMPIVITDLNLNIVRLNDSFAALTGFPIKALLGKSLIDLEENSRNTNTLNDIKALTSGEAPAVILEKTWVQNSGQHMAVTSTVSSIRIANEAVYLIALVKDITVDRAEGERNRLHTLDLEKKVKERTLSLELARDDAIQANALKTQFVSTISHEIRTPMSGILGLAEVLSIESDGETKETADRIFTSARNLMLLVDDLLDMSKLESGKFSIHNSAFDLSHLLTVIVGDFSILAKNKNLDIKLKVDTTVPLVLVGDQLRIGQVLKNLVSNAIKFTETGLVTIEVSLLKEQADNLLVRFIVKNTGIGISENNQKKLFNLFVQVDGSNTRRRGGSGLGLVICERLVELMNGQIRLESELDKGTIVYVDLPLKKVDEEKKN